jgi:hypothetical protein
MRRGAALGLALATLAGGCGLQITSPDLFLIRISGGGRSTTLVVNDGGTIRCDRGRPQPIASSQLIAARDLAGDLAPLARRRLRIPAPRNSVFSYTVEMPQGTIRFPDTAGSRRPVLARLELFATEAAARFCRRGG